MGPRSDERGYRGRQISIVISFARMGSAKEFTIDVAFYPEQQSFEHRGDSPGGPLAQLEELS